MTATAKSLKRTVTKVSRKNSLAGDKNVDRELQQTTQKPHREKETEPQRLWVKSCDKMNSVGSTCTASVWVQHASSEKQTVDGQSWLKHRSPSGNGIIITKETTALIEITETKENERLLKQELNKKSLSADGCGGDSTRYQCIRSTFSMDQEAKLHEQEQIQEIGRSFKEHIRSCRRRENKGKDREDPNKTTEHQKAHLRKVENWQSHRYELGVGVCPGLSPCTQRPLKCGSEFVHGETQSWVTGLVTKCTKMLLCVALVTGRYLKLKLFSKTNYCHQIIINYINNCG